MTMMQQKYMNDSDVDICWCLYLQNERIKFHYLFNQLGVRLFFGLIESSYPFPQRAI